LLKAVERNVPLERVADERLFERRSVMQDHVYKVLELAGTSEQSVESAIHAALGRAQETVRNMRWFEVMQTRGELHDGKIARYQVVLKVGFTLE
jgi:flavin-binding protein dodecin